MMKLYYHSNSLRLVGKAWEIRAKLKELKTDRPITLQEYLKNKGH
jgi:hypothetical protein